MSRRSRRKTLSHAEIESFLSDISTESLSYSPKNVKEGINTNIEDSGVHIDSTFDLVETKLVRQYCKVINDYSILLRNP